MRGSNLESIIDGIRAEARLSTAGSRGVEDRDRILRMVNRYYETLWDEHDWEFLRIQRESSYKNMAAGQRFYDFPVGLRPDDISSVWMRWGNDWIPVEYGITFSHYAQYDSERNQRADPVQRWVVRSPQQFEVWPMPASNAGVLGFEGKRTFAALADNADNCQLDDQLIILSVAAEILAGNKQADAQTKMDLAGARLKALTSKASDRTRTRVGLGSPQLPNRGMPRISVAYVRNP